MLKAMLVILICVPVMFRYWPSANRLKEHILMLSALISVLLTGPSPKSELVMSSLLVLSTKFNAGPDCVKAIELSTICKRSS